MGKWLRQNLVLVSGIVLPVLLVAAFLLLERAPRAIGEPPRHDFLLAAYRHDPQHSRDFYIEFFVRDGKLSGRATPRGQEQAHPNRQHAGLFRYNADSNSFEEIDYELPTDLEDLSEPVIFDVTQTATLQLDGRRTSPDGFTFEYLGYRGNGGLLGELFGMGRSRGSAYVLRRDGAEFNLPRPSPDEYYYVNDLHFLGWVTGEAGSP